MLSVGYRLFKILAGKAKIQPTRYPNFSANTLALPD